MTRGDYGTRPTGRGFYLVGAEVVRVPVLDEDSRRTLLNVLWDPDRENITGGHPSFYTADDGGLYLFDHPSGDIMIEGRRLRRYKSRLPAVWEEPEVETTGPGGSTRVGISLFHTVGDRDRAANQINTEFKSLVAELVSKMGADPKALMFDPVQTALDPVGSIKRVKEAQAILEKSPVYPLWRDTVSPVYDEWNRFFSDQSSWTEFWTNWEEYEHWFDRFSALRSAVEEQVGQLHSPRPVNLSKTLLAEAGSAAAKAASDVWTIVRVGIYGALALGGVIALSSIVQNLRKGNDPMERWTALARGRR